MSARFLAFLRALVAICCLIGLDPAWAGPPGQFVTQFGGGIPPAVSSNFLAGVLDPANYTYSGASLRTITDATGAITYAPNNLLSYSNTFSNAAWINNNLTVTPGVSDPFGGIGASTLTSTGTGAYLLQFTATSNKVVHTIWARARLQTGLIQLRNPNNSGGASITSGTWTQVYTAGSGSGGNATFAIAFANVGDAVDIYAASQGAVTYETTPRPGDQVITQAAAYYGPAFDYDPVSHAPLGLRIEEARTNLAAYSQDFSNAAWNSDGTSKTSGIAGAPDGSSTVGRFAIAVTSTNFPRLSSLNLSPGAYTFSAWMRVSGSVSVAFTYYNGVWVTSSPLPLTGTFQRVSWSTTVTGTTSLGTGLQTIFTGGGGQVDIWGFQVEAGSFPTSYIPTAASPVSRAADVVQIVGPALRALQGVQGAAVVETGALSGSNGRIIGDLATTHAIIYQASSTTTGTTGLGPTISPVFGNAGTWATTQRSGITWSGSGTAMAGSGGVVNTSATPLSAAGLSLYLGNSNGVGFINGYVRKDAFYNRAPTAPQLQARTVLGAPF